MIKGIGIDLVELSRIKELLEKNERFLKRILTEDEQAQYKSLPSFRRQLEYAAGRFAAKEAFAKAAGTGIGKLQFIDIEILSSAKGAPVLRAKGYNDEQSHVTISHSDHYAVANVIIEVRD